MIYSNANRLFSVIRNVAELLNTTATVSLSLTYQPVRESLLQVRVFGGTANTGTVTINGIVVTSPGNTTAGSETLTFTGAGYQSTAQRFTTVSSITTTGFANESTPPTVVVKATGADGSIQHTQTTLRTGWPGFVDTWRPSNRGEIPSLSNEEKLRLFVQYDEVLVPRVGDVFADEGDGAQYFVRGTPQRMGGFRPLFWELRVDRRDRSATV